MKDEFVKKHFLVRKFLRAMYVGERQYISNSKCSCSNLKVTATQLKKMGEGVWRVTKKTKALQGFSDGAWVTRER